MLLPFGMWQEDNTSWFSLLGVFFVALLLLSVDEIATQVGLPGGRQAGRQAGRQGPLCSGWLAGPGAGGWHSGQPAYLCWRATPS